MNERIKVPAAKKQPWLRPQFVRAMLAGHSALGLAFAALIYIVCVTGSVTVFVHELHRWEQPDAPLAAGPATPAAVQTALDNAYAQARADNAVHDIFIMGPGQMTPRFSVHYHSHETGKDGEWIANSDGTLAVRAVAPWSEFLSRLHMDLHLPHTWGLFLVGLIGVTLLSSLVSGVLAHPRIFKDAFSLRWGGSNRLQNADLHNRLSVWGLPFHFVVTLTGSLLGLSTAIIGVLAVAAYDGDREKAIAAILGPGPTADEAPAPLPNVVPMMNRVLNQDRAVKFASLRIAHVGEAGQAVQLGMRAPGHVAFSNTYYFDGAGNAKGDGGVESGGVGQQILGALQPLHFGWFGGLTIKLVYAALGLALTVITQSGVVIWLARKREKGAAVPHWERAWAALTWSQPLAFGTTALVALSPGGEGYLLATYLLTLTATALIAWALPSAASVTRIVRIAAAVALLLVPFLHLAIWNGRITDIAACWLINALFMAASVAILVSTRPSAAARTA